MSTLAEAQVAAVRDLHKKTSIEVTVVDGYFENFTDLDVCAHCDLVAEAEDRERVSEESKWPCATIEALDKATA